MGLPMIARYEIAHDRLIGFAWIYEIIEGEEWPDDESCLQGLLPSNRLRNYFRLLEYYLVVPHFQNDVFDKERETKTISI
jgi:hypothetical protein